MVALQTLIASTLLMSFAFGMRLPYSSQIPEVSVNYTEHNFSTILDHYSSIPGNFTMRYFTNGHFYKEGGPLFFYCGNEAAIETFIKSTGFMEVLAEEMNGLIVFAEHRYFGKSLPFGDESFSNAYHMKFLSPHQALADYAYLISSLNRTYAFSDVVAVGGSYGAMLAAWFRMKYPHIVDVALAASAPLNHMQGAVDPELFNAIVTNDYNRSSPQCAEDIHKAIDLFSNLVDSPENYPLLQEAFNTCQTINSTNVWDIYTNWLNGALVYMAMTDYPYPTSFLNPMPAWPVDKACFEVQQALSYNSTDFGYLNATRAAGEVYYNYDKTKTCNDISNNGGASLGMAGWNYLACTTLIMPSGSNGKTDFFLDQPWNLTTYLEGCYEQMQSEPQVNYAEVMYGASSDYIYTYRGYSQILFSNGALDPWQSGAVTQNVSDTVIAFTIADAAHHLDLRTPNKDDPESVRFWRSFEIKKIKEWIGFNQQFTYLGVRLDLTTDTSPLPHNYYASADSPVSVEIPNQQAEGYSQDDQLCPPPLLDFPSTPARAQLSIVEDR